MAENPTDDSMDIDDLLSLTDDDIPAEKAPAEPAAVAPKKRGRPRGSTNKAAQTDPAAPTGKINPTEGDVAAAEVNANVLVSVPENEQPSLVASETADQKRIRELEAQLSAPKPAPVAPVGRPLADSELSPEQLRIRELEQALAVKKTREVEESETLYADAGDGEKILLHFLEDGLIVNGVVTYRGQEMEFEVGSLAHRQTKDRNGKSFLDLLDDIDGQYERYGTQYFARGPWRGHKWGDTSKITDPEDQKAMLAAAEREARRNRAAPIISGV